MPKPDYSTWHTKQQAAEAIGVSTKTIEQMAKGRKLQAAHWKRPETGATIVVYHPDDVQRLRKERNPEAEPFVMPATEEPAQPETKAIATKDMPGIDLIDWLLRKARAGVSENSEKAAPVVPLQQRLYLDRDEAAQLSGLSKTYLEKQIKSGKLPMLKGAGENGSDVVRRADLEKL